MTTFTLNRFGITAGAIAASAAIALSGSAVVTAATVQPFGTQQTLGDPGGMMVTGYTVTGLAPSNDAIPYRAMGRLYEANLTVEALRGSTMPVIPPFLARSASGQTYRELASVPTSQGVAPMMLMQGQRNSGKLYFDVTGEAPNSVAYNDGMMDLMLWVGPTAAGPAVTPPPPAAPMPAVPPPPMMPAPMMPAVPPPPAVPVVPAVPPPPAVPMMPGY
ncbi:MPT63 family protein [Mycolicibacterium sp.]|uniref:MPT63 family protein n=1 Tax=Mycolicibacterium sp. TaxID=2320850 RepID=UPI0028A81669|nr:MPT63 family protein [Mycolicibacterium sp.]